LAFFLCWRNLSKKCKSSRHFASIILKIYVYMCECVYIYIYLYISGCCYSMMYHSGALCSTLPLVFSSLLTYSLCYLGKLKSNLGTTLMHKVSECNQLCTSLFLLECKRFLSSSTNISVCLYHRRLARNITQLLFDSLKMDKNIFSFQILCK